MKLTKEDIRKYGTKGEQKKLFESFEDEHGIPLGDEQDQSDIPEERPIEDEQLAGTSRTFDEDFAEEPFRDFVQEADDETLMMMAALIQEELESRGLEADVDESGLGDMKPWEKY